MSLINAGRPTTARPVNEPPLDLSCGEADTFENTHPAGENTHPAGENQVGIVVDAAARFRRAPASRPPVLPIRISVGPHGRSRSFALSADALDELLAAAARLGWQQ
jgi:hypothetical protein